MGTKALLRRVIPRRARAVYHAIRGMQPLQDRECPICGYKGRFDAAGRPLRLDAMCRCGSLERHRQLWLWMRAHGELQGPVLHFAPEAILEGRLRKMCKDYRTADLFQKADLKLNIEQIDLPTASIGTILCSHVLEHVNDRKALAELKRILVPGGLLIAAVPIVEGWATTYENAAITSPTDRFVHFGQDDHVRFYGRDFRERLAEAGFEVTEHTAQGQDVITYGLLRGDKLFLCRNPG